MHVAVAAAVVGAVLSATGIGCLVVSILQVIRLQTEVNEKLPRAESPRPRKAVWLGAIGATVLFLGIALILFGLRGINA